MIADHEIRPGRGVDLELPAPDPLEQSRAIRSRQDGGRPVPVPRCILLEYRTAVFVEEDDRLRFSGTQDEVTSNAFRLSCVEATRNPAVLFLPDVHVVK